MTMHRTKDGKEMKISEMSDSHLKNTIALIERKAKEGVIIACGSDGGGLGWDFYYDEDFICGDDVLDLMNYEAYINEFKKRHND